MSQPSATSLNPAPRVAVIGAGPGGLTAALTLKRLGLAVSVWEQAPRWEEVGGGILLHSNGLRVLDALCLLDGLAGHLRYSQTLRLEAVGGQVLSSLDCRTLPIPHNHAAAIMRYRLADTLLEAAQAEGVPVHLGHAVVDVTILHDPDIGAGVRFATADGPKYDAFDIILACDGVRSPTRKAALFTGRQITMQNPWLRSSTPVRTDDDAICEIWGDDGRGFGILPLPGNETHFFCTTPSPARWEAIKADATFRDVWLRECEPFGARVTNLLRHVPDWSAVHYGNPGIAEFAHWYKQAVFLVGDAAHAMPPNMGQGANAALTDAFVLSHLLADGQRNGTPLDTTGARYEAIRRPFMQRTQGAARDMLWMSHLTDPLARHLRDTVVAGTINLPWVLHAAAQIAVGYNPAETEYLDRRTPAPGHLPLPPDLL